MEQTCKMVFKFSERCAVSFADEIIGDNNVIVDYVFDQYNKKLILLLMEEIM